MMTEHSRIALDPSVLAGKPVIRGSRLSVEFVIGLMADGWNGASFWKLSEPAQPDWPPAASIRSSIFYVSKCLLRL